MEKSIAQRTILMVNAVQDLTVQSSVFPYVLFFFNVKMRLPEGTGSFQSMEEAVGDFS